MKLAKRSGQPEWDGQRFALDDPRIPEGIRAAASKMAEPFDSLWFTDTREGGEWYLMDDAGELIEVFWLEK
jgi:hypothetical protein